MTHYDIDYSAIPESFLKEEAAIQDIKNYLGGQEKFDEISNAYLKEPPLPYKTFSVQMAIVVGLVGYPVTVWYDYIYGPNIDSETGKYK